MSAKNNTLVFPLLPLKNEIAVLQPPAPGASAPGVGGSGVTPVSPPPQLASYGVDTLVVLFHASIPQDLLESMAVAKSNLQSGLGDEVHFPFGASRQFSFNLQRQGTRYYQYQLVSGDVRLSFATRKFDSTIPNMSLSVGSISCQDNLKELYKSFRLWMSYHGITIMQEKVSRLDLCADIPVAISDTLIDKHEYHVSRSKKVALYLDNYELTGVQVGKEEIVMRVYDKIKEMRDKRALPKILFFQNKWGNVQQLTRVEFQIRREVIKEFFPKNSTFHNVTKKLGDLWKYLTSKWFRQVSEIVDRSSRHQDRYLISEFWQVVQSAFDGTEKPALARNRKQLHINIPALITQATGIMLTVASAVGHVAHDLGGIIQTVTSSLTDSIIKKMEDSSYQKEFDSKWVGAVLSF